MGVSLFLAVVFFTIGVIYNHIKRINSLTDSGVEYINLTTSKEYKDIKEKWYHETKYERHVIELMEDIMENIVSEGDYLEFKSLNGINILKTYDTQEIAKFQKYNKLKGYDSCVACTHVAWPEIDERSTRYYLKENYKYMISGKCEYHYVGLINYIIDEIEKDTNVFSDSRFKDKMIGINIYSEKGNQVYNIKADDILLRKKNIIIYRRVNNYNPEYLVDVIEESYFKMIKVYGANKKNGFFIPECGTLHYIINTNSFNYEWYKNQLESRERAKIFKEVNNDKL